LSAIPDPARAWRNSREQQKTGVSSATCCKISKTAKVFVQASRPRRKALCFFGSIFELIQPRRHRISRLDSAAPGFCCSQRLSASRCVEPPHSHCICRFSLRPQPVCQDGVAAHVIPRPQLAQ
jgi:hypothetical protein